MPVSNDAPHSVSLSWRAAHSLAGRLFRPCAAFKTRFTWVVLIGICVATIAVALIHAGDYLVVDDPKPSDLIVVLGGDDGSRLAKAVELSKSGVANEVIVDADAQHRWLGRTEADDKRLQLASMAGMAAHMTVCPITQTSTIGETQGFYDCIHQLPVHRVLIVTSEYHTRRALSIFSRALPQYQWSVAAAQDPGEFGTAWWKHGEWASTTFGEWEKILWWQAVDRWHV